jgi:hypothetical protein
MEKKLTDGRTGGRTSNSPHPFRIAASRRVTPNLVRDGEFRPPFDF